MIKYIIFVLLNLISFVAFASNNSASFSFDANITANCNSLVKTTNQLNADLNAFKIDKQIQIIKCYKTRGLLQNGFKAEITWTGGFNRCDNSTIGSDFYKFLQLKDDSIAKKIILEKLGFIPISIKNYSYNYMITLCQLYLDE